MIHNPDILITESTIGKYTLVTNSKFAHLLLYQLHCPVIVVRDSTMPWSVCDKSHIKDNW